MHEEVLKNANKLYKLQMRRIGVLDASHSVLSTALQSSAGSSVSTRAKHAMTTPGGLRKQVLSYLAKLLPVKRNEFPSFAEAGQQEEFLAAYSSTSKRSTALIDEMLQRELKILKDENPDKLKEFFENAKESNRKLLDEAKKRKTDAKNKIANFDPEGYSKSDAKEAMKEYKAELKKAQSSYDAINKGVKRNTKYLIKMADSVGANQETRIMLAIEEARQIGKNVQRNYDANSKTTVKRKSPVKKVLMHDRAWCIHASFMLLRKH